MPNICKGGIPTTTPKACVAAVAEALHIATEFLFKIFPIAASGNLQNSKSCFPVPVGGKGAPPSPTFVRFSSPWTIGKSVYETCTDAMTLNEACHHPAFGHAK